MTKQAVFLIHFSCANCFNDLAEIARDIAKPKHKMAFNASVAAGQTFEDMLKTRDIAEQSKSLFPQIRHFFHSTNEESLLEAFAKSYKGRDTSVFLISPSMSAIRLAAGMGIFCFPYKALPCFSQNSGQILLSPLGAPKIIGEELSRIL